MSKPVQGKIQDEAKEALLPLKNKKFAFKRYGNYKILSLQNQNLSNQTFSLKVYSSKNVSVLFMLVLTGLKDFDLDNSNLWW